MVGDETSLLQTAQVQGSVERPTFAAEFGVGHVYDVEVNDPLVVGDHEGAEWAAAQMGVLLDLIAERRPERSVEDGVVTEAFYGISETFRQWRNVIPSAAALHPLYRPYGTLANGFPIDEAARRLFAHSLDGRGIRSRGTVLSWLLAERGLGQPGAWASLACGAAYPVCVALSSLTSTDRESRLVLLDWDPSALVLAEATAEQLGVAERMFTHEANVLNAREVNAVVQPASCSVVECLGFFEYIPSTDPLNRVDAASFLELAYSLVAPGGSLVFANMLNSHPELPFTMHAVSWPLIQPRSLGEILAIVDRAGIDRSLVDLWLPDDGVYVVVTVRR